MTTPSNEEKVVQQKLKDLSALVEQRELIQARIAKTEAAIRAFIALLEDETDQALYTISLQNAAKPVGLTESIKRVLRNDKGKTLTPVEVRDKLAEAGFPLSGYANPLAVIYTTLGRLAGQKVVKKAGDGFTWSGDSDNQLDAMVARLSAGLKVK